MALGEVRRLVFCLIRGGFETVISGPVTFFEVGAARKLSIMEFFLAVCLFEARPVTFCTGYFLLLCFC